MDMLPDPNQKLVNDLARRRKGVYEAIRAMEAASIGMIARHLRLDKSSITGRLDELRDMGLVQFSHKDLDPVTGITVHYWKLRFIPPEPEKPEYDYTIDGVPYTWTEFIKQAKAWGHKQDGFIVTTSECAAYLRSVGHKVEVYDGC